MNKKGKRQGHQEDVSVCVSVCIWLRESDLCVHVCVGQSEVQAGARKRILWQHAELLSDATQEHDVRRFGCSKTSALRLKHTHKHPHTLLAEKKLCHSDAVTSLRKPWCLIWRCWLSTFPSSQWDADFALLAAFM